MEFTVKTQNGSLCGEQKDGFIQFLGVPFAKPPVGPLRFRKPQPPEPWEGVRQAKEYADYCVQPGKADTIARNAKGSEDCLNLNIFTPACDRRKRPVVVWIHGGAYLTGTGSSPMKRGGKMCVDSDIVVVAVQYRLGAFGCVDFASLSGANGRFDRNCGTWDQLAAVNWVIENISDFGGDPACITLLGESAGACSVMTLMTTPYLKGKIKRVILDSPAPFLMNSPENGYLAALDVAKHLGISEAEAYRIAEVSAEELTAAVNASEYNFVNHRPYLLPTAPVVDGDLLPEPPFDAVMHGAADGIDMLIGTTRDEASIFATGDKNGIIPGTTRQMEKFFADHKAVDRQAIVRLYPGYPGKSAFREIGKEIFFHLPTLEIAYHMAGHGRVYLHHFDYVFPVFKMLDLGAVHCTNSALISGEEPVGVYKLLSLFSGRKGKLVSDRVHHYWCNFIAFGDPNGAGEPYWPECGDERNTLFLDVKCHVEKAPFEHIRKAYGIIRPYGN